MVPKIHYSTFKFATGDRAAGRFLTNSPKNIFIIYPLSAYSDSSLNGDRIDIKAENYDRWVVFEDHAQYKHMDSDIESVRCVCRY